MAIKIFSLSKQGHGSFDHGRILENKPIGFPGDGSELKPYSTLFYWAHAWSDQGGLIDRHPHKGFEIMSFVLEGSIEHYDNQLNGWKRLDAGDVQIIRAGNGIVHAERILPKSAMFQIWIDPNLNKTLGQPASYNDYRSDFFPTVQHDGYTRKSYTSDPNAIQMDTPGVEISRIELTQSTQIALNKDKIHSIYVIAGRPTTGLHQLQPKDFLKIDGMDALSLEIGNEPASLFLFSTPINPGYGTYAQMYS